MKIVLTGGIAAGKTLATEYLRKKGFAVLDADEVSREIAARDESVRSRIAETFGARFVTTDGLERRALRAYVFADRARVAALDDIMLPAIFAELQKRLDAAAGDVAVAVPLWFDTPYRLRGIDGVWTVTAPAALRIKRLTERDTTTVEAAQAILDAQVDDAARIAGSDRVLVNDGSEEAFFRRIDAALGE